MVELLVVIVISCLLVVMVYSGVRFFIVIYMKNKNQNEIVNSIYTLQTQLWHEIAASSCVDYNHAEKILRLLALPKDTISYVFFETYMVRKQKSRSDTTDLIIKDVYCVFMDHQVFQGIIDRISFTVQYGNHEQLCSFKKSYSPYILLNYVDPVYITNPSR